MCHPLAKFQQVLSELKQGDLEVSTLGTPPLLILSWGCSSHNKTIKETPSLSVNKDLAILSTPMVTKVASVDSWIHHIRVKKWQFTHSPHLRRIQQACLQKQIHAPVRQWRSPSCSPGNSQLGPR